MSTTIHDPAGPLAEGAVQLVPAAPALVGGSIGVLDNGKPNARLLLTRAAEGLAARIGGEVGERHRGEHHGRNTGPLEFDEVVDTPRRTRSSIGRARQDDSDLLAEALEYLGLTRRRSVVRSAARPA